MIKKNFLTALKKIDSSVFISSDFILLEPYLKKAMLYYGVAYTPLGQKKFLEAILVRKDFFAFNSLIEYLSYLRQNEKEWLNIFSTYNCDENIFFRNSMQFEVAKELIDEWSVMASDRTLKVLVVGNNNIGFEVYSVAIVLEELGLRGKGWAVELYGFDLNAEKVLEAEKKIFSNESLEHLPEKFKKKWFNLNGIANWRIKEHLLADIDLKVHNIYDLDTWPWPETISDFNLIFARGLTWQAANLSYLKFANIIKSLAADSAFVFTDNMEILTDNTKRLELEERYGVLYYRLGDRRVKLKKTKIKELEIEEFNEEDLSPKLGLREENLFSVACEKILLSQDTCEVECARELVWELINNLQELSIPLPEAWGLMAFSALKLGQTELAKALANLVISYQTSSPIYYYLMASIDENKKEEYLNLAQECAIKANKHWSSAYYELFKNFEI